MRYTTKRAQKQEQKREEREAHDWLVKCLKNRQNAMITNNAWAEETAINSILQIVEHGTDIYKAVFMRVSGDLNVLRERLIEIAPAAKAQRLEFYNPR